MDVVERIEQLREQAGLSVNQLAKRAGVGQASLSQVMNRKNKPSLDTLERLCDVFGITLAEFFAESPEQATMLRWQERIQRIERLPSEKRDALIRFIDVFSE